MNGLDSETEQWCEERFARLALYRTVGSALNIVLSMVVIAKLFGWI